MDEADDTELWTAEVSQQTAVSIGEPIGLSVDLREACFFDPVGGDAIPLQRDGRVDDRRRGIDGAAIAA